METVLFKHFANWRPFDGSYVVGDSAYTVSKIPLIYFTYKMFILEIICMLLPEACWPHFVSGPIWQGKLA